MRCKIVVALGGNALQTAGSDGSAQSQLSVVKSTASSLVSLVKNGYEISIVHGNGPQVGRILQSFEYSKDVVPVMPFDVCGAMSQGYIGYHIQQALQMKLRENGLHIPVSSIITQIVVDKDDAGFKNPSKPIGSFYSKDEAKRISEENGYTMKEDAGRGYRRVVASPIPKKIVEIEHIRELCSKGIVISCGGGGIPIVEEDNAYHGVDAVIDKDYAAELLAEELDADILLILTEVEKVCINWQKDNQQELDSLDLETAKKYIAENQFAPGSMLPKILACTKFIEKHPEKKAIITSLDKALLALQGKTGTVFTK